MVRLSLLRVMRSLIVGGTIATATATTIAIPAAARAAPQIAPMNKPNGSTLSHRAPVPIPGGAAPVAAVADMGTKQAWHATAAAPQLLWTGFRTKEKSGEVLIQTSSAVEIERVEKHGRDVEVFVLKHCRALRRTDRLPLETRFFDSPVTRVSVRQRGRDLEVSVALRAAVSPTTRKEEGPGGSWFWVLQFPVATNDSRPTTAAATP